LDVGAAIEQGRYITLDVADALPTFILNGILIPLDSCTSWLISL
jgi:hypothetical protein